MTDLIKKAPENTPGAVLYKLLNTLLISYQYFLRQHK